MKTLFYRVVPHNGGVVFATPEDATNNARIHRAIGDSSTWGEFGAAMPCAEYSRVIRSAFDDLGEPRPKPSDLFTGESVPGWSDGDYPPWLQAQMDRVLPETVLRTFGRLEATSLNGPFWMIPATNLDAICAALSALGWTLRHEPDLLFH